MPRMRMLSPDFHTDPKIVKCTPLARLLFVGLLHYADREGRLEADPMALKLRLLPADNANVSKLLGELAAVGLVAPYTVDGRDYLLIVAFKKRQRPHPKEPASVLPPPSEPGRAVERNGETRKDPAKPSESESESTSFPSKSGATVLPILKADKKPKTPSRQEALFALLADERRQHLGDAWTPDEYAVKQVNTFLKHIVDAREGGEGYRDAAIVGAFREFLRSDYHATQAPPFRIRQFASPAVFSEYLAKFAVSATEEAAS